MQIIGKLIQILPLHTGAGKNGEWKKQDIIIETDGQYPKNVCVSIWGERIISDQLIIGNQLVLDFDIESKEFGGRWYTDLKAWKVEVKSNAPSSQNNLKDTAPLDLEDDSGGLPF